MNHFIQLFSPHTFQTFKENGADTCGFRSTQKHLIRRLKVGDYLYGYITIVSRWACILKVHDEMYIDKTPFFTKENDPFIYRFHVRPILVLDLETAVPIYEDSIWNNLSFTKEFVIRRAGAWTGKVRSSLTPILAEDGAILTKVLEQQVLAKLVYPTTPEQELLIKNSRK